MIQSFPLDKEPPEIPFCDEIIETAATLRIFLELSNSKLSKTHFSNGGRAVIQAIEFLNKYDCQMSKCILEGHTLKSLTSDCAEPKTAFIIGALLGSDELTQLVLRLHGTAPLGFDAYTSLTLSCDRCECTNKGKHCKVFPMCSQCQCFNRTMGERTQVYEFSQTPAKYLCALVTANNARVLGATPAAASKAFSNALTKLEVSPYPRQVRLLRQDGEEVIYA